MGKLTLSDEVKDIAIKMCEGNPGALEVLMGLMTHRFVSTSGAILLLWLDLCGIYGSEIWILFKDKCHSDWILLERTYHAMQLGHISLENIKDSRFDAATATKTLEEMQVKVTEN